MLKTVFTSLMFVIVGFIVIALIAVVLMVLVGGVVWLVGSAVSHDTVVTVAACVSLFFVVPAVTIGAYGIGKSLFEDY